jgi:hypothetical protein
LEALARGSESATVNGNVVVQCIKRQQGFDDHS